MPISAPFGYKEIVPFLKTQRVRLLAAGKVAEFVQRGNAVRISHSEFQKSAAVPSISPACTVWSSRTSRT